MKTPIQELIEIIKKRQEDDEAMPFMYNDKIIALAESMLKKEKDEIIDAHIDGQCDDTDGTPFEKAEQYYNETFNTKER
jgi:hypothetical protein